MSTGSVKRIGIDTVPGPGSYQLKTAPMTPQYSMAGKPPKPKNIEVPGPGSYNNEKFMNTVKSNKSIPIGFEQRLIEERTTRLTSPGPGSYKKS